jgi:hypothetical protein
MVARELIVNCNGSSQLFVVDDLDSITNGDLLSRVQQRMRDDDAEFLPDSSNCLCEGPYAGKPLDDRRVREIDAMLHRLMVELGSINQGSELKQKPIYLWFCHCNKTILILP